MKVIFGVVFRFSLNYNKMTRKTANHDYGRLEEDSLGYPYVCLDEGYDQQDKSCSSSKTTFAKKLKT